MPLSGKFERFDGTSWSPMPEEGFFTPRGTLHTWRNAGEGAARLFILNTGGSFDIFLEKLVGLQMPRDLQQLIDISAEHGISYVLPSAPDQDNTSA